MRRFFDLVARGVSAYRDIDNNSVQMFAMALVVCIIYSTKRVLPDGLPHIHTHTHVHEYIYDNPLRVV